MKLYTKTGDKGTTGLIGGTRVNKNDVRLEAYGTVDELNAQVGLLVTLGLKVEHEVFLKIYKICFLRSVPIWLPIHQKQNTSLHL